MTQIFSSISRRIINTVISRKIINVSMNSPFSGGENYYKKYEADDLFVNVSGDTMTGILTLSSDPTELLHAATKQYVDTLDESQATSFAAADELKVNKAGDTMTGQLDLYGDPITDQGAATKKYVDDRVFSGNAIDVLVDSSLFSGNLSPLDVNVQKMSETIDQLTIAAADSWARDPSGFLYTTIALDKVMVGTSANILSTLGVVGSGSSSSSSSAIFRNSVGLNILNCRNDGRVIFPDLSADQLPSIVFNGKETTGWGLRFNTRPTLWNNGSMVYEYSGSHNFIGNISSSGSFLLPGSIPFVALNSPYTGVNFLGRNSSSRDGCSIRVVPGLPTASSTGANTYLMGGSGSGSNQNGGDVAVICGLPTGTGSRGTFYVENGSGAKIFNIFGNGYFCFGSLNTPTPPDGPWSTTYTTRRTINSSTDTTAQLADSLATLVEALKTKGILS